MTLAYETATGNPETGTAITQSPGEGSTGWGMTATAKQPTQQLPRRGEGGGEGGVMGDYDTNYDDKSVAVWSNAGDRRAGSMVKVTPREGGDKDEDSDSQAIQLARNEHMWEGGVIPTSIVG